MRSNVRVFRNDEFAIWRCKNCGSIHARDEVDLAYYYAKYPFHDLPLDWRLSRHVPKSALAPAEGGPEAVAQDPRLRLRRRTFRAQFLAKNGYRVQGFDEYSSRFGDRRVLDDRYDCIVSQDVIEHVAAPHALLGEFKQLTNPGALIAVGTPNASAIDLSRPEDFVHTLHAPYHRHILSRDALIAAGEQQGWSLARYYPTMYSNTLVPFLNETSIVFYARIADDTLDALLEPIRVGALLLRAPITLFWGFFGSFFARGTDVMAVFRK